MLDQKLDGRKKDEEGFSRAGNGLTTLCEYWPGYCLTNQLAKVSISVAPGKTKSHALWASIFTGRVCGKKMSKVRISE